MPDDSRTDAVNQGGVPDRPPFVDPFSERSLIPLEGVVCGVEWRAQKLIRLISQRSDEYNPISEGNISNKT